MPVNLSIKNVPEELTAKVKEQAVRNHRSLQGELMAIIESSVKKDTKLTPREVLARVRSLGLRTAPKSTDYVREDRDAHHLRR